MVKYSEFIVNFVDFLHTPATSSSLNEPSFTNSRPVMLEYVPKKSPVKDSLARQWLTPFVSLCVQSNSISLYFICNVSQVDCCFRCPLVIWPCDNSQAQTLSAWYSHGPVPVERSNWFAVASRKLCNVLIISFLSLVREKCDLTVHLDTVSYFAECQVEFEFQTILSTDYEICNFLQIIELIKLLEFRPRCNAVCPVSGTFFA